MNIPTPHFILFSQANRGKQGDEWSFVLKAADGSAQLEATDAEPDAHGERLELLAVVRGLEALEQPSRVTLVTPSRYVSSGISYGLPEWGRNGWMWEHFGQMVPVKNRDLWQRLDRALKIHHIRGTSYRVDEAHGGSADLPEALIASCAMPHVEIERPASLDTRPWWSPSGAAHRVTAWVSRQIERLRWAWGEYGTSLLPCPWLN